jgi:hypothetical protein
MYNNKNIYCVWYPSGGFGHFINTVLTHYGTDFVRPASTKYQFSATGNSHNNELVAQKFLFNPVDYKFDFGKTTKQYSVLVDNGINDESKNFINTFPQAKIIKVCYSTLAWPVVASTAIHKAMESNFDSELAVDQLGWSGSSNWAQREKYFLFLAAHHHRMMWKPETDYYNLLVDDMLNYNVFYSRLSEFGIELTDFSELWDSWYKHNQKYIFPVVFAKKVMDAIDQNQSIDISHCQDLWTQAVVNYFIWDKFNYTVPANDFANWFTNTDQIIALLAQQHASA